MRVGKKTVCEGGRPSAWDRKKKKIQRLRIRIQDRTVNLAIVIRVDIDQAKADKLLNPKYRNW